MAGHVFQRGITLIETCTTLAIAAVLASVAAPSVQTLVDTRRLDGAATELATDIQFTRTAAVARNEPLRLSLKSIAGGSCYVIHSGNANQCSCGDSGAATCTGGARPLKTVRLLHADHLSLQGNVASVLFDPLHGTSTPTGTLRVVGMNDRAVHHTINVMGRVRSCSPDRRVPGYRPC